jgi:2-polyprenyl-3-methyl-5-hydroxy-6-metoxy-1,4-benzoquinol methylase
VTFSWDKIERRPDGKIELLYRHERIFAELFISRVRQSLDVGGWGMLAARLLEEGIDCTILDKFTSDQYYADRVRSLPHKVGDVRDATCFAVGSFDMVTCFECLEHVGGITDALASMFAWLRPEGHIIGTVPIPGQTHAADEPGIEFTSDEELTELLLTTGFVDVFTEPTPSVGLSDENPASIYFRGRKP